MRVVVSVLDGVGKLPVDVGAERVPEDPASFEPVQLLHRPVDPLEIHEGDDGRTAGLTRKFPV